MKQNIKISFLILTALLSVSCSNEKKEEYFSGTIDYAYSYTSDSINVDSLAKERPAKGNFRYDETNYQSRFTGKDTVIYYYSGNLNKALSEQGYEKKYSCEDYGIMTDSVLSHKIYDTDEKVLGYSCRILEVQKERSWVKHYISKEIKIAPATYVRHRSYNWDYYGGKAAGGIILQSEHRFPVFTLHGKATSLVRQNKKFRALEIDEAKIASLCNDLNQ